LPHNRLFHPESFAKERTFQLDIEEAKHAKVFRLQKEELCELVNGKGEIATVKVLSSKDPFTVEVVEFVSKKEPPSFTLAMASVKLAKLELIIQKGCELGVSHFQIFDGELSEKKGLSSSQLHRLQAINISALKQSGRLFLPAISFPKISLQNFPQPSL